MGLVFIFISMIVEKFNFDFLNYTNTCNKPSLFVLVKNQPV